jgi:ketosteroid isomerase-like protein
MTLQEKNIQTLKSMFETCKKGDYEALLNYVADDCDWWSPVTHTKSEAISWASPRHGRGEISSFFKEAFAKVKPIEIKPTHYTAQNDYVIVEGSSRGMANATGCEFFINWVMVCALSNGKIMRLRNYYDTADLSKALLGTCEVRKAA